MTPERQRRSRPPLAAATQAVVRKHRPDYQILLFMSLLMLIGLIIMFAIGPQRANVLNNAFGTEYADNYFFLKQLTSVAVAFVAFFALSMVSYKWLFRYGKLILMIGLGASALLALAGVAGWGIAQESYGATRWFSLGPLGSFQPAEIIKFGVLLFLAVFLGAQAKRGKINNAKETFVPVGVALGLAALFIVIIQKDLGTGVALAVIVACMLLVAGVNKRLGIILVSGAIAATLLLVVTAPHRVARVLTFFEGDSTSVSDAGSYHIEHAKIAIGTGGLFGVGIGNSVQATGYLPEAINDSVFAIMGETFGLVGLLAVLFLFTALLLRLLKVMDHLVDIRLRLLTAGVFGWFAAHVMLNIGAMIGLVPLTGITLPLLSFGGTSMVFLAAALGLVFQLSKYTTHGLRLKEGQTHEDLGSRGRLGRTRYASRRSTQKA